jgi:cysteine-rich repeat protein
MYNGKMVLNHRGSCEFCVKAKMAREAGARAVIVINNDESKFHIPVGACLLESWCATSQLIFPTCLGDGTVMPGYGVETRDEGNKNSGDGCNSK